MGDTALWPVTITDETFLHQLKSGVIRFHGGDLLRVDMEAHQKRNKKNGVVTTRYTITEVIEYVPHREPERLDLGPEPPVLGSGPETPELGSGDE